MRGRLRGLGPIAIAIAAALGCSADRLPEQAELAQGARGFPRACADLYDEDLLPTFELTIAPEHWSAIVDDCSREYQPATLRYGDESAAAMVRNKGNWSFSCEKPQFVISFNETDSQARFHGLRKLVLDAPFYDRTLLRERLAFHFLARYGSEASCANNARLLVNGAYLGLYANVERIDREYLERHYDDPSGDLWKAGRELKTNEDMPDHARIDAFWAAREVSELATLVDLEQAVRAWAGQAMLPDRDSYWLASEDPRRPFDEEQHRTALVHVHDFLEQRARFVDDWLQTARCPP
jgi:hypothetical protein